MPGSASRPGPLSHRSTLGTCSSVPRHFFDIRRINAKQLQNTCQGTIGGMAVLQQASWRLPPGCAGVAVLLPQVPYRFSSLFMRIENPYTQWVWTANPDLAARSRTSARSGFWLRAAPRIIAKPVSEPRTPSCNDAGRNSAKRKRARKRTRLFF